MPIDEPHRPEAAATPPTTQRETSDARRLSEVGELKALAHPVRMALMEVLALYGPLTATQAGERINESPTTCSFHLRQLARYGFVEEAGGGKGRARPWKVASLAMQFAERTGDAETDMAAAALVRLVRRRALGRYETWLETKHAYPERWQDASDTCQLLFFVTVDELEELNTDVQALLSSRFRERLVDPATRPAGSVPVEMLVFTYPIAPEHQMEPEG